MSEPANQLYTELELSVEKKHLAIVQKILQNRLPDAQVWAFGSRTTSTPKPYSDLDLAVIDNKPTNLELLATLAEDFSNSDLPFKVGSCRLGYDQRGLSQHHSKAQNSSADSMNL